MVSEDQIEHWIEKQATSLVDTFLDLTREDHEEERSHENSQEKMEALVRATLRGVLKLTASTPTQATPVVASPASDLFVSSAQGQALRDLVRDFLFAHTTGAPASFKAELAERAAKIYWDSK